MQEWKWSDHRGSARVVALPCLAKPVCAVSDEQRQDVGTPNEKSAAKSRRFYCCCKCYTRLKRVVYFTCRAECEASGAAVRRRPTAADRRP
jgi:hypothetical protein